ncbi:DNA-processing protein DprA [uncultured Acetobacterium sp.]|uniref:DNA-processing protein DprA n=1 Tax=uncultured Acetobacterium sp. TaxID=217139 RepID=UPI0025E7A0F1|nr:DNA-processing protein DprA [uncultured Acetobacterium sp.]
MNRLSELIIGLRQLKGVGRQKIKQLLDMIIAPESLSFNEIIEIGQTFHLISSQIYQADIAQALAYARRVIDECDQLGIQAVSYFDDRFPESLKFDDQPILLYYKGDLKILNHSKRAAVIGSRSPSQLGCDFAFQAGKILAENNFVVISGLAVGADDCGHRGCLEVGGKTVAFLPSGLSSVYPSSNCRLAEKICTSGGALVSEYSHLETVQPYKFIERDRLQSGASGFVIVSSFSPGSGTIHTLRYASKYNKPIYSIPVIYDQSRDGFNHISLKNIDFQIKENTDLNCLIENY